MAKYGHIEISSLVLYNGMEEEFITYLPVYNAAYMAWDAATRGVTPEEMNKLGGVYDSYEQLKARAQELEDKLKDEELENRGELESEYQKVLADATGLALKITQNKAVQSSQIGLSAEQLKTVDEKRKEYVSCRDKLIAIIAQGLLDDDITTPITTPQELNKLRGPVKEKLIYDVGSEPENGIPLNFIGQLGAITPVGVSVGITSSVDTAKS